MKEYNNPLDREYHSAKRLTLRIFSIVFYVLVFPQILIAINMLLNFKTLSKSEKLTAIIVSLFFVGSVIIIGRLLFTKSRDLSLRYIRGLFNYKELHESIEKETFEEIPMKKAFIGSRADRLYQSEHWLFVDGFFIPKNFVLGSYALVKRGMKFESQDLFEMQLVLINGKEHCYSIGVKDEDVKETYEVFKGLLPSAMIKNNFTMANYKYERRKALRSLFSDMKSSKSALLEYVNSERTVAEIIEKLN